MSEKKLANDLLFEKKHLDKVAEKVKYVKSQAQSRKHTCHWPNCAKQVPPAMWGCKPHWFKLPANLRNEIWQTYKVGQEVTMTPSKAYLNAADKVEKWIFENAKPNS